MFLAITNFPHLFGQASAGARDKQPDDALALSDAGWIVALFALAVVAAVAIYAARRYQGWRLAFLDSPAGLFRQLCRAHHVSRSERRLLWRLSEALQLDHPARLFVEPDCYDVSRLDASWQSQAPRLAALRTSFFA